MKKAISLMLIVSLLVLNGCQQTSEKVSTYQENYEIIGKEKDEIIGEVSNTIYESIDRSNAEAKEVMIGAISNEGEDVILPQGRYQISAQIAGNVYIRDKQGALLFHDIIAYSATTITVDVNGSHTIHVDGFDEVLIKPVSTQLSTELTPGIWEVGKDIEEGNYTVTGSGFGYLQIFEQGESPQVYEVIGGGSQSKSKVQLKNGQKIKITGVSMVEFKSKSKS